MKDEELKSLWRSAEPDARSQKDILLMLEERRHPVLKSIKMQITIELMGWSAFLACYYSMFDGAMKPLFINIVLIVSVLVPFVHNLYGYNLVKNAADRSSILASLKQHLQRIKIYASASIISRVVFTAGFLLFFSYNISFNSSGRYLFAAIILVLVIIQIIILHKIWQKRIRRFQDISDEINRVE